MKRSTTQIGAVAIGAVVYIMTGQAQVAREATTRGNQVGSVVTVSGCLLQMSGGGSTMGGSTPDGITAPTESINQPSTASATDQERFILTDVSGQRYLVTGLRRDDLRKEINHHVEVSGRVEESREPDSARAAAASDPERPGDYTPPSAAARVSELPQLNATSLRMIAQACSPTGSSD